MYNYVSRWHKLFHVVVCSPTADDPVASKILSYNRANRAVAILCNHQVLVCVCVCVCVCMCV